MLTGISLTTSTEVFTRMKKDLVYWIYLRQQLFESVQNLTEAQRELAEHNLNLIVANKMAHDGNSSDVVHRYLQSADGSYISNALNHWYRYGGDLPIHNFIRKAAIRAFDMNMSNLSEPHFEGKLIHDNVIHQDTLDTLHRFHNRVKSAFKSLPDTLTVYRGIGLPISISAEEYKPHALESWTTHLESAKLFSTKSHLPNSISHVFKATINKNDIFASYHAAHLVPGVIPSEEALEGKQEVIPFGDKLKNIERIL